MAPRCRSWRPTKEGLRTPQVSAPGVNRSHWQLCRTKVEPGQVRCDDCATLLCQHSDVEVRRLFSGEQALAKYILEILIDDPDVLVADRANAALQIDVPDDNDEELVAVPELDDEGENEW